MPSAKSQDKLGLQALKLAAKPGLSSADREKGKKLISDCRREIKESSVQEAFTALGDYFLSRVRMAEIGQSLSAPTAAILTVGRFGMVQSAEFAWAQFGHLVTEIPLPELLAGAPSVRLLDMAGQNFKDLKVQVATLLNERPEVADGSAAFEWLAQRAKPKELCKFTSLLLANRHRLPHLATHAQVLRVALLRDKSGEVLRACLAASSDKAEWLDRLRGAVLGETKLLTVFLAGLPKLLTKPEGPVAAGLVESWLSEFPNTPVTAREAVAGTLAALGGQLLQQQKRSELASRLLEKMGNSAQGWITTMETTGDFANFWLLAQAAALVEARKFEEKISPEGAILLTSALEKAKAGYSAEALLEALALNLGMSPIGTKGDAVSFDTTTHEDTVGGMLTGDGAVVVEPGWHLGERIVRRSKVTPKST